MSYKQHFISLCKLQDHDSLFPSCPLALAEQVWGNRFPLSAPTDAAFRVRNVNLDFLGLSGHWGTPAGINMIESLSIHLRAYGGVFAVEFSPLICALGGGGLLAGVSKGHHNQRVIIGDSCGSEVEVGIHLFVSPQIAFSMMCVAQK